MLLRPHTLPGGKWHDPIWSLYSIYAVTDYTYGWPAYESADGWGAAQAVVNAVESLAYIIYLYLVYQYGVEERGDGRGAPGEGTIVRVTKKAKVSESSISKIRRLANPRTVHGGLAASLALLGFSIALATELKTILYGR